MCFGQKESAADYKDVFYLHMYDRRLPRFGGEECQDCNDWAHRDHICTFTTAYFTHKKQSANGHQNTFRNAVDGTAPLADGDDLKCPFQTETRTVTRYNFPDTHSGSFYTQKKPQLLWKTDATGKWKADATSTIKRCSSYTCEKGPLHQLSYTSKVWFTDDDAYEYPYCKSHVTYFSYTELKDHKTVYDTTGQPCTLYEH